MLGFKVLLILPLVVYVTAQSRGGIGYYGTSNVRDQRLYPQPLLRPRPLPYPGRPSVVYQPAPAAPTPAVTSAPAPVVTYAPPAPAPSIATNLPPQPSYRPSSRPLLPPRLNRPLPSPTFVPQPAPLAPPAPQPQPSVAVEPQPSPVVVAPEPTEADVPQPPVTAAPIPTRPVVAEAEPVPTSVPGSAPAPQPESVQPESAQPEPTQPEPAPQPQPAPQPDPAVQPAPVAQPEPTQAEPIQPEPAQPEPVQPEPTQPQPAQPIPDLQPQPAPEPQPAQPEPAPQPVEPLPELTFKPLSPVFFTPESEPSHISEYVPSPPILTAIPPSGALPPLLPKPEPVRQPVFGRHAQPQPDYPQPTPQPFYPQPDVTSTPELVTQAPPVIVSQAPPRPTGSFQSDFDCKDGNGHYAIDNECDAYIECKANRATKEYCPDGLNFNPAARWHEYPCAYPSEVKCLPGAVRQTPKPTDRCPRQYGFFAMDDADCSKFIMCQEGIATIMDCPAGLAFNPATDSCDWPENVPLCNPHVFEDFVCPDPPVDEYGLVSDVIFKYRYHKDCKLYVACQRGHPRLLSCEPGLAFNEASESCINEDFVTDCTAATLYSAVLH